MDLLDVYYSLYPVCPQPCLWMLVTQAPGWILDLISYFIVSGTVGRLIPTPVCSIPWNEWGAYTQHSVGHWADQRYVPGCFFTGVVCSWGLEDFYPGGFSHVMILILWVCISKWVQSSSAMFPSENMLKIFVIETCLFCYPKSLVVV